MYRYIWLIHKVPRRLYHSFFILPQNIFPLFTYIHFYYTINNNSFLVEMINMYNIQYLCKIIVLLKFFIQFLPQSYSCKQHTHTHMKVCSFIHTHYIPLHSHRVRKNFFMFLCISYAISNKNLKIYTKFCNIYVNKSKTPKLVPKIQNIFRIITKKKRNFRTLIMLL